MNQCTACGYAKWRKTLTGRLHPDGSGRCMYPVNLPKLPASMWWFNTPVPSGGAISRKEAFFTDPCIYKSNHKGDI